MSAPHLPPKTCSIKTRQTMKTLPWIIGMMVISILSGLVTALAVVTWFYPQLVTNTTFYGGVREAQENVVVDATLERFVTDRVVRLYDISKKINNTYYPADAYIGDALLLSSDGWVVLYDPTGSFATPARWEAIDSQGIVSAIETIVIDPNEPFTYMKLEGEGYRVTSFYQWSNPVDEALLWAVDEGSWVPVQTDGLEQLVLNNNVAITDRTVAYKLDRAVAPGTYLLDASGNFVGFSDEDGYLLPSWLVERQVGALLANGQIDSFALPYAGTVVASSVVDGSIEPLVGFYVFTSPTQPSSSTIGVGDLIVRIQNQPFTAETLPFVIATAPSEMQVTVMRKNSDIDIIVTKNMLQ